MELLKKIDFRIGTIVSVKPNIKAKNPSFIVDIDFGGTIGKKTTSAQLPATYTEHELLQSKQVVCIVNFPMKKIAGLKSEVLIVGFPNEKSKVFLLNIRNVKVLNGKQILYLSSTMGTSSMTTTTTTIDQHMESTNESNMASATSNFNGNILPEITYEQFEAANIIVGTIKHIQQEQNSHEATLTVDFGETIGDKSFVVQNLSSDVVYGPSTQLPVAINEQTNEIIPLAITQDDDHHSIVLLGVDRQVPNGGKLY
ncbi:unnamed protein product [Rotaria socialis]|uniref:tRNA-binding domain-containing protein n=1 Tax=Rotaria socialis TaxID=392032 RepID=A0A820V967_9BILA|nr:unnamed protein product [Rotaria socialis]CAF3324960.1 unnamed protein product [Rotaria socialis]CAF3645045.1 unnamed protein product [Rotaria socialis]CAF3696665.1 unnamed protein product [Rotaria socialis]CAF3766065.1 unnamed protein product [Rotaria socialis]